MASTEKAAVCSTITDVRTPSAADQNGGKTSTPKTWPVAATTLSPARRPVTVNVLASPLGRKGTCGTRSGPPYTTEFHRHIPDMSPSAVAESRSKKPDCSYAVLIGIAMRAAQAANYGHQLPVIEIYRFIEKEFPYFKRCKTTGWKNCVRHCLSLGQFFRKVDRCLTESTLVKGNYWEVIPDKRPLLNRDIQNFVLEEYKSYIQKRTNEGHRSPTALAPRKQSAILTKEDTGCRNIISTNTHTATYVTAQLSCNVKHTTPGTAGQSLKRGHDSASLKTTPTCISLDEMRNGRSSTGIISEQVNAVSGTRTTGVLNSPSFNPPCSKSMIISPTSGEIWCDDENPLPSLAMPAAKLTASSAEFGSVTRRSIERLKECTQSSPNSPSHRPHISSPVAHSPLLLPQTRDNNTHMYAKDPNSTQVTHKEAVTVRKNLRLLSNKTCPPNTQKSQHITTCSETTSSFVDDSEKGDNPLINPTHPVVSICTLALLNCRVDMSERADVIGMPNAVTYVTAPTTAFPQLSCTPTYSNQSTTRMAQRVYYPLNVPNKNAVSMSSVNNSTFNNHTSLVKQRRREQHIPPSIQPVLKHMNHPSLFLPSSQFYNPPPYLGHAHNHQRRLNEHDKNSCNERFVSLTEGQTDRDNIIKTQNGERDSKCRVGSTHTVLPTSEADRELPQLQNAPSQEIYNVSTNSTSAHDTGINSIFSNNQSSVAVGNTLVQGVADHTPSVIGENDEMIFEVSSDWLPLTIAREEEVTSLLLDDIYLDSQ